MIDKLRKLLSDATPGPWLTADRPESNVDVWVEHAIGDDMARHWEHDCAVVPEVRGRDALLIVAMYEALPALLDVAEAAGVIATMAKSVPAWQASPNLIALVEALAKLSEIGNVRQIAETNVIGDEK